MAEPVKKYRDDIIKKFHTSEESFTNEFARLVQEFATWKASQMETIQKAALSAAPAAREEPQEMGLWDIDDEKENAAPQGLPPTKKPKTSAGAMPFKSPINPTRTPLAVKQTSVPQDLNTSSKAYSGIAATPKPNPLEVYNDTAAVNVEKSSKNEHEARADPCGNLLSPLPVENKPGKAGKEILEMSLAERKKLTVAVLRAALKSLGLNTRGKKAALLARIAEASRNNRNQERKGGNEQKGTPANKKKAVSDAVSVKSPNKEIEHTEQKKNEGEKEENAAETFKNTDSGGGKKHCPAELPLADDLASKDREGLQGEITAETRNDNQYLNRAEAQSHAVDEVLPTEMDSQEQAQAHRDSMGREDVGAHRDVENVNTPEVGRAVDVFRDDKAGSSDGSVRKRRRSQGHTLNTAAMTPVLKSEEPANVDGEEKVTNQNPAEVASTVELQSLLCQEELDTALNENSDLVCEEKADSHQVDEDRSNPIVSSMDIDEDDATGTEKDTGFSKGDGAINKPSQNDEVESVSRHKPKGDALETISSLSPKKMDQGAVNSKPPPRNLMGTLKSLIPFISRKENGGSEDERKKGGGVKIKALAAAEAAKDAELLKQEERQRRKQLLLEKKQHRHAEASVAVGAKGSSRVPLGNSSLVITPTRRNGNKTGHANLSGKAVSAGVGSGENTGAGAKTHAAAISKTDRVEGEKRRQEENALRRRVAESARSTQLKRELEKKNERAKIAAQNRQALIESRAQNAKQTGSLQVKPSAHATYSVANSFITPKKRSAAQLPKSALAKGSDTSKVQPPAAYEPPSDDGPRLAPEHLAMLEKVTAIEQREKSTVMSYIISPRKSCSDSGEDEHENSSRVKAPPKPIPHWARREQLVPFLQAQEKTDPDEIFPPFENSCNLQLLFQKNGNKKKERFDRRSDSGEWGTDKLTWRDEWNYKKAMGYL